MSKETQEGSEKVIETKRVPFDTVLKCKLTDKETLAYAKEMADVNADVVALEAELKSLAAEYKGKIALKEARREMLGKYVSTGHEHRTVKCERSFDYTEMLVTEVRLDGQEPYVINQRGLTPEEKQKQLAL